MKKITARELPPEQINFRFYFDDEGLTSKGGKNCAIYIPGNRNYTGFNSEEYRGIVEQAESILDGFYDVCEGGKTYFETYKDVMEYYNISYTSWRCHLLKEWSKSADITDTNSIARYLTVTTGEQWNVRSFSGYCQGDYCEVIYCKKHYTEKHITEIGKLYLGCGTEFCIDGCYCFYVVDNIRWQEGELLKNYLAECYGCNPEQLDVYLYKGSHEVADYELMAG